MNKSAGKWLGIIYQYECLVNGKLYIGKTTSGREEARKREHKNSKPNSPFHQAILEFGWENFKYTVLERDIDSSELSNREKYWITKKKSNLLRKGYNNTISTYSESELTSFQEYLVSIQALVISNTKDELTYRVGNEIISVPKKVGLI